MQRFKSSTYFTENLTDLPQEGIGPNRALLVLNLLGPMKPSIKLHTRTIQLGLSIVKIEGSCMGLISKNMHFFL